MSGLLIAIEGRRRRRQADAVRRAAGGRSRRSRQVGRRRWRSRATTVRSRPTSRPRRCTASTATSPSSVYAMAVLFALDRAGARDEIGHLAAAYDVVILDRYVASNAAYSAARLHQQANGDGRRVGAHAGIRAAAPAHPRLAGVARRARRAGRASAPVIAKPTTPTAARDSYERDDELQRRTGEVYAGLAAAASADAGRSSDRTSTRRRWRPQLPRDDAESHNLTAATTLRSLAIETVPLARKTPVW